MLFNDVVTTKNYEMMIVCRFDSLHSTNEICRSDTPTSSALNESGF
jgi:hypothetical protein